jgi:RNA polymerase sigma-70 factor (ECF subfamily)
MNERVEIRNSRSHAPGSSCRRTDGACEAADLQRAGVPSSGYEQSVFVPQSRQGTIASPPDKETRGNCYLTVVSDRVSITASVNELERLYRSGFHRYLRVAEAIAGNPDSGLDAVQEGFARALRHRSDFRGEAQVSTWVWACVVNAAKAARPQRESPIDEEFSEAGTEESRPSPGLRNRVRNLIVSLPERQRLALFLRYYADLDYRSIAGVLGVEIGTVGATLNKAHAALRRQLEEVPK